MAKQQRALARLTEKTKKSPSKSPEHESASEKLLPKKHNESPKLHKKQNASSKIQKHLNASSRLVWAKTPIHQI